MNMERSKNIVIICLILINLTLFGLFLRGNSETSLSAKEIAAITSALEKNGITLNAKVLRGFGALRQIAYDAADFSENDMTAFFFGNNSDVTRTEEFSGLILSRGEDSLTLWQNSFAFDSPYNGDSRLSESAAERLCDERVSEIKRFFGVKADFLLDRSFTEDGARILEYRAKFSKNTLYSVYIRFTVTGGIIKTRGMLSNPLAFYGDARPIYSADEALFQLMFRLTNDFDLKNEKIAIDDMEIVYYEDEAPYYRFYISADGVPINLPYLINAYTNTILY